MSFDRERDRLQDIIENIDAIHDYIANLSAADFAKDRKSVDAVERCLQRITEAVIQIGEDRMRAIDPSLPSREVRGLGNMLRHEYRKIDPLTIFETAMSDLPPLRAACETALGGTE